MHLNIHQALVPLTSPVPLRLTAARGTRVRSLSGTLWVTIDGDLSDHMLEPGESVLIDSDAQVLVSPLGGTATVGLCEQPQPEPGVLARLIKRVGALLPARHAVAGQPVAAQRVAT